MLTNGSLMHDINPRKSSLWGNCGGQCHTIKQKQYISIIATNVMIQNNKTNRSDEPSITRAERKHFRNKTKEGKLWSSLSEKQIFRYVLQIQQFISCGDVNNNERMYSRYLKLVIAWNIRGVMVFKDFILD